MVPHKCFYLEAAGPDKKGTNLFLETATVDKYAPKKTGAYDVSLKLGHDGDRKAQQWYFDDKTFALHSMYFPKKVLFEGYNKNLIMFAQRGLPN